MAANGAVIGDPNSKVGAIFDATEKYYTMSVLAPDGQEAMNNPVDQTDCFTTDPPGPDWLTNYHGNGAYVLDVKTFTDNKCTAGMKEAKATYTVATGAVVGPPAQGPILLSRQPGQTAPISYVLPVAGVPGNVNYQIAYAANAVLGVDGGITGTPTIGYVSQVNPAALSTTLSFPNTGVYTIVARAAGYDRNSTPVWGPWGKPLQLRVFAPFDFDQNAAKITDSKGPSYALRAQIRNRGATGKVKVSYAYGTKGGRYKNVGTYKISKTGTLTVRFRTKKLGHFRLRYTYKGDATTAPGTVTEPYILRRTFG